MRRTAGGRQRLRRRRRSRVVQAPHVVGPEASNASDASGASGWSRARWAVRRRAFEAVSGAAGLMTQACQPARIRLYCDFGMNLDEAFMIWNDA